MRIYFLALLILSAHYLPAQFQNLVPNPSFELYKKCPNNAGQIDRAEGWFSATGGTPDFFNACYTKRFDGYGVPNNFLATQPAQMGKAYAGIFKGDKETEYIQVKLKFPLEKGKKYVFRAFAANPPKALATHNSIGFWFTKNAAKGSGWAPLPMEPGLAFPTYTGEQLNNWNGWALLQGIYEAAGDEAFLTIGYFRPAMQKTYTFIDNVFVCEYTEGMQVTDIFFNGEVDPDPENLLPNSGFESMYACPELREQLHRTRDWRSVGQTPDFFASCGNGTADVPENFCGTQFPATGEAYGGFWAYFAGIPDYREGFNIDMKHEMRKGAQYCISAKVSLAEISEITVDQLHVRFAEKSWSLPGWKVPDYDDLVTLRSTGPLNDRDDWTLLTAAYTATGLERNFSLGYFLPDTKAKLFDAPKTDFKTPKRYHSSVYFYLDDVAIHSMESKTCPCSDSLFALIDSAIAHPDTVIATAETAPEDRWEKGNTVTFRNILFETDQSELLDPSFPLLDSLAAHLAADTALKIAVTGHTDDQGGDAHNDRLSEARAHAVRTYLIDTKGIAESRITASGAGRRHPVADNSTPEGRAMNRRVTITFE